MTDMQRGGALALAAKLREAASKATPGERKAVEDSSTAMFKVENDSDQWFALQIAEHSDAEFIALANPRDVTHLCAALERAAVALEHINQHLMGVPQCTEYHEGLNDGRHPYLVLVGIVADALAELNGQPESVHERLRLAELSREDANDP